MERAPSKAGWLTAGVGHVVGRVFIAFALAGVQFLAASEPLGPEARKLQGGRTTGESEYFGGIATLERDGTIVIRIVSAETGGPTAHGYLRYPPTHPEYKNIVQHVGRLKVGIPKAIEPWPSKQRPDN
jgi:hypothetical protein